MFFSSIITPNYLSTLPGFLWFTQSLGGCSPQGPRLQDVTALLENVHVSSLDPARASASALLLPGGPQKDDKQGI